MIKQLVLFVFIFLAIPCFASNHLFLGYGQNYANIDTIRLGVDSWEFGLLSRNFYGGEKVFPFGAFYTGFGLGLLNGTLGFQGSAGFSLGLLQGLFLRGELYAVHGIDGRDGGQALLGAQINF
ncbi:MAG: hypothetical protein KDD50_15095 [Bdellovibrionales bacterium]|nr:hypothetical protein [Bdellovibrionales bacterium]